MHWRHWLLDALAIAVLILSFVIAWVCASDAEWYAARCQERDRRESERSWEEARMREVLGEELYREIN